MLQYEASQLATFTRCWQQSIRDRCLDRCRPVNSCPCLNPRPLHPALEMQRRIFASIKANLGTLPQTMVPSLASSRNFDKIWHPWNDMTRRDTAYFRNGDNQDNCLFSAISVTPEFMVATKFPFYNQLPPTALGKVECITEKMPPPNMGRVATMAFEREKIQKVILNCSRTNVYAVKIKKGHDTEAFQSDPFPERAYTKIRWIDHFAVLKVIRIHYSGNPNDGHLVLIDGTRMLPSEHEARANVALAMKKFDQANPGMADSIYNDLKAYVAKIAREGKLFNKQGGIPYTPPGVVAKLKIKEILGFGWS